MQISEITAFLESAYDKLNQHYFNSELPPVVITVQSTPKAYGHYTPWLAWSDGNEGYHEINLGAETLNRGIEQVIATLVHEMTHGYNDLVAHIKDTSRGNGNGRGTYHNRKFKEQAEKRGLIIEYDPRIGWSVTTPAPDLIAFVQEQGWNNLDLSRVPLPTATKKPSNVRKYICPSCGCSVRATKEVHIACLDCAEPMVVEDKN